MEVLEISYRREVEKNNSEKIELSMQVEMERANSDQRKVDRSMKLSTNK